ncbi:TRAP transporter small permease subunit [Paracoccus sp. APAP_BH8]|uniref:TRAP transporter small permease n=1 Tax=Paracoccus sp. APAP_BH8 TaxID=3110237 RepID=UPI002FD84920
MRKALDKLYQFSGYLAAAFLVGILISVMWQVGSRWLGHTADATEAAGMCLAAATFFGLAHTFRAGAHVRINLLTSHLAPSRQRWFELFNCAAGSLVIGYLTWNMWALAYQSWMFHDVSPGLLAMPFWVPQTGVAVGLTFLFIALLDELVWLIQGNRPRYDVPEIQHDNPVA